MKTDNKIRCEKLQYNINMGAAKISPLLFVCLIFKAKLHCNHNQIVEQTKYIHCPLGKAFEKQTKTIQGLIFKSQSFKSLSFKIFKSY